MAPAPYALVSPTHWIYLHQQRNLHLGVQQHSSPNQLYQCLYKEKVGNCVNFQMKRLKNNNKKAHVQKKSTSTQIRERYIDSTYSQKKHISNNKSLIKFNQQIEIQKRFVHLTFDSSSDINKYICQTDLRLLT